MADRLIMIRHRESRASGCPFVTMSPVFTSRLSSRPATVT